MPSTSTSSERGAQSFAGQFFDGETAASHAVGLTLIAGGIEISDQAADKVRLWSLSGLEAVDAPLAGQALRLRHTSEPASRLTLPAGPAAEAVLTAAPFLARAINPHRLMRQLAIVAASLVVLAVVGYAVLSFLPQVAANLMPDTWRQRLGDSVERTLIEHNKVCGSGAGLDALAMLDTRLSDSIADAPRFSVEVVALPVVNAFALPGGRIVVSGKLIAHAQSPEEVAGVLAHELGHVYYRHPEAQFARLMGMQLLLTLATGTSGGNAIGGLAGILAILRYSRAAEAQADAFAERLMTQGGIDPRGLRDFFARMQQKHAGAAQGGVLSGIGSMLSSHPGTAERIAKIKPLPPGEARPVLSAQAFRDLKAICR